MGSVWKHSVLILWEIFSDTEEQRKGMAEIKT